MAWREFKELDGLSVDVAMFPVDNRLEDAMEWGAIEFLRRVQVKKGVYSYASKWSTMDTIRVF